MNKILRGIFVFLFVFCYAFSQDFSGDIATDDNKTTQDLKADTLEQSDSSAENDDEYHKSGTFFGIQSDLYRAANLGIAFGYQFYFGMAQRQGIKITTHFHLYYEAEGDVIGVPKNKNNVNSIGFDIKYLYDFLELGHFVLGLNAGLGYQKLFLYDKIDDLTVEGYYAHKNDESELKYGFMGIVGMHMYYRSIELEVLSGYPNILRVIIAYRF